MIDDIESTYDEQTIYEDLPLQTEEKTRIRNKLMQAKVMEPEQKKPALTSKELAPKPEGAADCVSPCLKHYLFW